MDNQSARLDGARSTLSMDGLGFGRGHASLSQAGRCIARRQLLTYSLGANRVDDHENSFQRISSPWSHERLGPNRHAS